MDPIHRRYDCLLGTSPIAGVLGFELPDEDQTVESTRWRSQMKEKCLEQSSFKIFVQGYKGLLRYLILEDFEKKRSGEDNRKQ
jgi:hypothetical protein